MAVSRKQDADIAELCRSLGYTEAAHPFGYGYMVRTESDLRLAVARFRERVGKDPVTFNWKPSGSLILSAEKPGTAQEYLDARRRPAAPATREVDAALSGTGAGREERGPQPASERSTGDVVVAEITADHTSLQATETPQPLSELPGVDARCDICGGDMLNCWCNP